MDVRRGNKGPLTLSVGGGLSILHQVSVFSALAADKDRLTVVLCCSSSELFSDAKLLFWTSGQNL